MDAEFLPYKESLALKELGFDEECMALFTNGKLTIYGKQSLDSIKGSGLHNRHLGNSEKMITAPLYQQAFRWFREKYKYLVSPFSTESEEGKVIYYFEIGKVDKFTVDIYSDDKSTYEEAELACLEKLIEIVKDA
jgi:hypothetical protein